MARFCEKCGHEMDSGDKFCEKCGNRIGQSDKCCSSCGAVMKDGARFCTVCGHVAGDVDQKSYLLFLVFGYLCAFGVLFIENAIFGVLGSVPIGLYLMTRPETQENKMLYLHGTLLVVMPLVFFIIRICFL